MRIRKKNYTKSITLLEQCKIIIRKIEAIKKQKKDCIVNLKHIVDGMLKLERLRVVYESTNLCQSISQVGPLAWFQILLNKTEMSLIAPTTPLTTGFTHGQANPSMFICHSQHNCKNFRNLRPVLTFSFWYVSSKYQQQWQIMSFCKVLIGRSLLTTISIRAVSNLKALRVLRQRNQATSPLHFQ